MPVFKAEYNEYQIDHHIDILDKKYPNFIDNETQWIIDIHRLIQEDIESDICPYEYVDECSNSELKELKELVDDKLGISNEQLFRIDSIDDQARFKAVLEIFNTKSTEEVGNFLKL